MSKGLSGFAVSALDLNSHVDCRFLGAYTAPWLKFSSAETLARIPCSLATGQRLPLL